ncbi:cobalamin biosynthesis protein [Nocardia yunnanensis]|uniref:Cobalamin biosynthesis protein n=1 Tax=Nocardia yunnanensis TaxID=2382165 RepID=A0A386ZJ85_9NOCA|nr:cobalamin biosynthesis protein [Nocardia yunnanensis]AYF77591.1 cobalamin biosynthesis protein [Nocardia yunnanensis]
MPQPELAVGLGLRPGTPADAIVAAVRDVLGAAPIGRLATIEQRAREQGFAQAAERLGASVLAFTAAQLDEVSVPHPSERVAMATGTGSVAEAAALLASGSRELAIPKKVIDGLVIAAAIID